MCQTGDCSMCARYNGFGSQNQLASAFDLFSDDSFLPPHSTVSFAQCQDSRLLTLAQRQEQASYPIVPLPTAEQQQVLDEMVEDVFGTTMPAANPFALDREPPFYNQNDMVPSRRDSEVAPAARYHVPVWINPVFPPQKAWTGFVCQVPYEDPHQQPPYRHQSLLPFAPLPQPIQPLMPHHPLPPPAPTPPRRPLPHRPLAHRPYPNRQPVRPVNAPANTPAPAPDAPPAKRFKASKGDKPDAQGFVNEDLRSVKQRFKDLAHAGDFVAAKVTKRYKNKDLFRYKKEKVEVVVEGGEEMSEEEMRKKGLLRKCEKNG